jgi:hypothetical protein
MTLGTETPWHLSSVIFAHSRAVLLCSKAGGTHTRSFELSCSPLATRGYGEPIPDSHPDP